MKLLAAIILSLMFTTVLYSETTMCFKENHKSMTTIEKTKLDGGICQGQKSVTDMHKDGWVTSDIKINNSTYIYVFKKNTTSASDIDMDALEAKVVKRLHDAATEKKKVQKEQMRLGKLKAGKRLYTNVCQDCHGPKGFKNASNTSRAIANFNLKELKLLMNGYINDDKDVNRGRALIMRPYATNTDSKQLINIYVYLKNINSPKSEKLIEEKK